MAQKQTSTQKITDDVTWVGVLDADLEVFDIIMETKFGTTYNAYIVNTTEGAVIIETVKETFFDSYIDKLKSIVGDINNVKYLITNHTEPDHSGSIKKMIDLVPGLTVVGSRTAITYLKDIVNEDFTYRTAEDLKVLKVGGKTFDFISVPFLHWPDSMYSYLREDNILFTCDSFGSHYSPKGSILMSQLDQKYEADFQEALLYYYTAIFGPFKEYVIRAYEKIKDLKIKFICDGHGPVLDSRCWEIIETYRKWSLPVEKSQTKKAVVIQASAYGYTTEIGNEIRAGISEINPKIDIKNFIVNIQTYSGLKAEIMNEISMADAVILGTDTINGDAVPPIWDLALSMNPIVHGGKILAAFGSYGWSGEGVDNIITRMQHLRGKLIDGFKIKFRMSRKEQEEAKEYGRVIGRSIETGEVPVSQTAKVVGAANWEELNPTGKVVFWRCIICGEIFAGISPPLVCPACGVGQELFELYTPEDIDHVSTDPLNFVIIGSSISAIASIDSIRARNKVAKITMITQEDILPYYRPIIVDALERKLNEEEFYLKNENWYKENNIEIRLMTIVTKIDKDKKKVFVGSEEIPYDKLIIATGAIPFVPPIGAAGLEGAITIRTASDVDKLQCLLKNAKTVVFIGGGVLGLENAFALRKHGLNIIVAECVDRLMPRQLDVSASEFLGKKIKELGIELKLGACAKIIGDGKKVKAVDIGGKLVDCDVVVINAGARANFSLAKEAGIDCERGINVNEKMETSDPNIYAAGDCAFLKGINQGLWSPAAEMGKVAGANAVGDEKTFQFIVEPVSLLAPNVDLLTVGIPPESEEGYNVLRQHDDKTGKSVTLYFLDGRLKYAVAFNMQSKAGVLISGVRGGHSIGTVVPGLF